MLENDGAGDGRDCIRKITVIKSQTMMENDSAGDGRDCRRKVILMGIHQDDDATNTDDGEIYGECA